MPKIAALIVLILFGAFGFADARTVGKTKIQNWDVAAHVSDSSGKFTHCASAAKYKSGITLLFSVDRRIEWAVGFSSPEWRLTPGNAYKVVYKIDGGPSRTGIGRAVSPLLVRMGVPDDDRLNEFRVGLMLAVTTGTKMVKFKLTDTNKMLDALFECAKQYRNKKNLKDL